MNIKVGDILDFTYTGSVQVVTLPKGKYTLECWGAQGGYRDSSSYGGKGGKSYGILTLVKPTLLYIYVGGSGNTGGTNGGFNGGGGASDIRIGTDSLYARVIVAGGGGSDGASDKKGMYGGGTSGGSSSENYGTGGGGTQTTGGTGGSGNDGTFGKGGAGLNRSSGYGGAGGGGWYGGGGAYPDSSGDDDRGGGGGSGFVWTGSNAPTGYLLGTEYYLANAVTKAGNVSFGAVSTGKETGHGGNGHVRITVNEVQSLNLPAKISEAWKNSSDAFIKINGSWKNIDSVYAKINGIWKLSS